MLIINADDWGRSIAETDAALACYRLGRITSVSAMVFMKDSERAARLSMDNSLDVGLHLNLSQPYDGPVSSRSAAKAQDRIVRFITRSKYAGLFYHPTLRRYFRGVYQAQEEEFVRLYGKLPLRVDGHHHRHLCANMLIDGIIPPGRKVRRNFSFWPGEKGLLNRTYRRRIDRYVSRRYCVTDYLFSLAQCLNDTKLARVFGLAKVASVELETHPYNHVEYAFLTSDDFNSYLRKVETARMQDCKDDQILA